MATPDLTPYPSPDERDVEFAGCVSAAKGTLVEYGQSLGGRPLLAGRFPSTAGAGDDVNVAAPAVLVTANIHGPEFISSALALRLARHLAEGTGDDALKRLHGRADIWIAPCLNPDGYARTCALNGDAPLATLRTNDHGVDLNRNFPIPPGHTRSRLPGQGSKRHGDATYIGAGPLSEPETAAFAGFLDDNTFVGSANVHSFMGTTIPPRVVSRETYRRYATLSRAFSRGQRRHRYFRLQSRLFDGYTGELEDHQHHVHRTWAMTVECFPFWASFLQHPIAPTTFWRFNPHDVDKWVDNDLSGVVSMLHAMLDLGPVTEL